ncbi:hypothetical protein ACH5RR_016797 [Cinchona calisaya]|uniref:Uncharacterized protein n=1 Tax=Cinchona calisaya TaxID=153742 RepID=A0ABD2ZXD4_9GENT
MNRSFRAEDNGLKQRQQQMGSLRMSIMKEKEDDLALFLEMRKREKERNNLLLLHNSDEFDAPLGTRSGSSPIFNIASTTPAPVRKTATEDFLNSDNDKNDYDWLLTPPGTPLFPSLEMESQKTVMSQLGTPKARPLALKSRLANHQTEPAVRSNLSSRQPTPSPGLTTSSAGLRRPSSSGGSRPSTPTGRPTSGATSKATLTSAPKPTVSTGSKPSLTVTSKATSAAMSKPTRSLTPTSRATLPSAKSTVPPRSSTPTARPTARSSTPTSRASIPASKPTSRSATPTRRPVASSTATFTSAPPVKSPSSSSVTKLVSSTAKNPVPTRSSSPSVKPRPWKPSDMPGFSLDVPPNLRTSIPTDRPISASRGRPGVSNVRSSSVEPVSNGRVRRQSRSPSRGRPPNGIIHSSGSSVPAANRLHVKANDNVSPVLIGTKMVERVINMRKLVPPKQDDKHSPLSNLSGKSSSPDTGFGRTLSKKSLDMAIRHMDIRRTIPGNLRPLMTNIPASSMYSVRSGPAKCRTVSVSDSPLATSSNASSEVSVNNNGLYVDVSEIEDDVTSDKVVRSPASMRGR